MRKKVTAIELCFSMQMQDAPEERGDACRVEGVTKFVYL